MRDSRGLMGSFRRATQNAFSRRGAILWILPLLASFSGCHANNRDVITVTGQIEGVGVNAGSRIGGRVSEVLVAEGDRVAKDDVLVRLEASEADAFVAAAQAQLDQAEALLTKLETGARPEEIRQIEAAAGAAEAKYQLALEGFRSQQVEAARASAGGARAQLDRAKADLERVTSLLADNAVSQKNYDDAKLAHEVAQAQYKSAQENLDLLAAGSRDQEIAIARAGRDQAAAALEEAVNGARAEDLAAARAARDAAAAGLRQAQTGLSEMVVKAPRDGVVESTDVHEGDLVKPGPIVRIVDPEDLELVVYVSAGVLGRLRLGQKVQMTADSLGDDVFDGEICRIPSQGEYTPRNLQTVEERVQQVFGIKVKLNSAGGKLKAGMTATAHIALEER